MKKLLALFATLAVAVTLSMPVFAGQDTTSTQTTTSSNAKHKGKHHWHHAKKHGAHKGKKKGEEGTNPSGK